MPDRVVRADILTSDKINSLSWAAEVFYRRLMSIVDDYGRYEASPALIRAYCYPKKLDRVSESDVIKWLGDCSAAGAIRLYAVNNREYLQIEQFGQRLRAMKSRYPGPSAEVGQPSPSSADKCQQPPAIDSSSQHMPSFDGLKRNESESETESETEKKDTPNGVGEAGASPPDPEQVYKKCEKNKKAICGFLKAHKPSFIEPYADLWNIFAKEKGLAQITKISDQRKRKFRVRIKETGFDFIEILKRAGQSEFLLTGKWFCFDWLLENESNYLKVIEGNYDKAPDGQPKIESSQNPAAKTFTQTLKYLVERYKEGDLDERLVLPEYYDKLQVYNLMPPGTLDRYPGETIDDKKIRAVIEFIKTNANVED